MAHWRRSSSGPSKLRTLTHLLRNVVIYIAATLGLLVIPAVARTQKATEEQRPHLTDGTSSADVHTLQEKATQAQARIQANNADRDQLKKAIKLNEVSQAKEVLLRNGFSAQDLEKTKITLLTGGGKGGKDEIEISATSQPKEIIIRRSLDYYTK